MVNKKLRYAAIPHLVIDSPAYADLRDSSVRLLEIISRQGDGKNNGLYQATFSFCKPRGIGSEHTLQKAIADLISHGFICRTRGHGKHNGKNICGRYAVTWEKLCEKDKRRGLFLDGFQMMAWQKWPFEEKSDPQKVQGPSGKMCSFLPPSPALSAVNRPEESADYELVASNKVFSEVSRFDSLSADIRKQVIKGRKHGCKNNLALTLVQPMLRHLEWRH